ncbi:conserved Plasmodium protein, unknown function [Plasmodium chabaudi chabaudi]|uniref:Uncharacterized protein n=1 Tax=Plasmodium chabaudi chabaudi TaxID=31271 RepID=A0A1D3RUU2_PLACU|nr:conserved Plasmodium protein, unknown function [Plasmodium chabaudi chabaudi]
MDAKSNGNGYENISLNNNQDFHPTDEIISTINEPFNDSTRLNNNEVHNIEINTNDQTSENRRSSEPPARPPPPRYNRRANSFSLFSVLIGIIINQLTGYRLPDVPSYLLRNNTNISTRMDRIHNAVRDLTENNVLGISQPHVTETPSLTYTDETQNNNEPDSSDVPNYVNKRRNDDSSGSTSENAFESTSGSTTRSITENVSRSPSRNGTENYTENASENVLRSPSRIVSDDPEEDLMNLISNSASNYLLMLGNNGFDLNQLNPSNLRGAATTVNQESCVNNGFESLARILERDHAYNHDIDRFVFSYLPEYSDIELTPITSLTLSRSLYDDYDSAVFADKYLIENGGSLTDSADSDDYDYEREYEMISARRNLNTNRVPISDIFGRGRFTIQDQRSNNISYNYSQNYDGDIFFYNDREYAIGGEGSSSNEPSYTNRVYGNNLYDDEEDEDEEGHYYTNDYRVLQFSYENPDGTTYRTNHAFSLNNSLNYDSMYDDYDNAMGASSHLYSGSPMYYETLYRNSMPLRRSPTEEMASDDTPQTSFSFNNSSSYNAPLNNGVANNDTPANRDIFDPLDLNDEPTNNMNFDELKFDNTTINGTSFNDDIFTRDSSRNVSFGTLRSRDIFSNEYPSDDEEAGPSTSASVSAPVSVPASASVSAPVSVPASASVSVYPSTSKALYDSDNESTAETQALLRDKLHIQYSDYESDASEYFDAVPSFEYNTDEDYFSPFEDCEFNDDGELEPMPSCSNVIPKNRRRTNAAAALIKERRRKAEACAREMERLSHLYDDDDDDDEHIF